MLRTAACTCVHFFNISTAKNAPNRLCFQHFDFQMCFVSHERALFDQLNFQKCSDNIRKCCAFYVLTSKRASRHSIVHLFHISTSKSAPRPHFFCHFAFQMCFAPQRRAIFDLSSPQMAPYRFYKPTFRPSGPQSIGKTQCFATF